LWLAGNGLHKKKWYKIEKTRKKVSFFSGSHPVFLPKKAVFMLLNLHGAVVVMFKKTFLAKKNTARPAATRAKMEDETGRRCEKMSAFLMVKGTIRQALPIYQPATESWQDRIMRDCLNL
jgi:hypothetical protein